MTHHDIQMKIEANMTDMGISRYNKAVEKRGQDTVSPGAAVIDRLVMPTANRISEGLADYDNGKAGRYAKVVLSRLSGIEPKAAAYIALRRVVHSLDKSSNMGQGESLTSCASNIGTLIEEHLAFETFRLQAPQLANWWMDRAKQTSHGEHSRRVMRAGALGNGIDFEWDGETRLKVGVWLIEQLAELGMVEIVEAYAGKRRINTVRLSPSLMEYLTKANEACALARPFNLPMVVKPLPWTTPFDGGYLTKRNRLLAGRSRRGTVDDLASSNLTEVYAALNTIQSTGWQVNPTTYGVLTALRDAPAGAPGIPASVDPELPCRPEGIPSNVPISELTKDQQKAIKAWRGATKEAYDERAKLGSQRVAFAQKLWIAQEFSAYDAIYFPHRLDSRGRIYPLPSGLTPQGDDLAKGLLRFAEGKPLGEDGAYWLAIQVANVYGKDKVTLDERVQWTLDNEDLILEVALSPCDTVEQWACADKPWQFLAACAEWAGYVFSGRSEDYVSYLPVAMDGSCSGLQHFSAALRDEVGGQAVNLVPTGKVEDIYTEVANRVNLRLNSSTCGEELLPWRGKVDRKVVKQPCMTYAYSATTRGMRDMIIAACLKKGPEDQPEGDLFSLASKLAPLVRECIEETVVAAAEAMTWLQSVASIATENNKALTWVSASGFPVYQERHRAESRQLSLWYCGARMKLRLMEDTEVLDRQRQREAIAPNWVHSQDAAHLTATVNMAVDNGITSFAMIHDSFGTHAGRIAELNVIIRETFVQQYEADRLTEFRDQMQALLGPEVELPPLPETGELDLNSIRGSDYFFA